MEEATRRIMLAQAMGNLVLPEGGETKAVVSHDHWCPRINSNQPCRCSPDIEIVDAKGRTVQVFEHGMTAVVAEPMRTPPVSH